MRQRTLAGTGGIAFGALTLAATLLARAPGGSYSASYVADYLAPGHRAAAIAALLLALLGVVGLVCLLAHLREAIDGTLAASVFWGAGLAGAACFAAGAAVIAGQVIAHWEGGSAVVIAPALTYLISEVGVVMIFGAGAILLGLALLVLCVAAPAAQLGRLRWPTFLAGLCGVASLAFFPFFLLMLWAIGVGARLLAAGRRAEPLAAARPATP
jgi:hypothetical protein